MQASDVAKRGALGDGSVLGRGLGLGLGLRLRFDSHLLASTGLDRFILDLLARGVDL